MDHATLTCIYHTHLRWSCKDIAVTNGRYNGHRNIHFKGQYHVTPDAPGWDNCHQVVKGVLIQECACNAKHLRVMGHADLQPQTATA